MGEFEVEDFGGKKRGNFGDKVKADWNHNNCQKREFLLGVKLVSFHRINKIVSRV